MTKHSNQLERTPWFDGYVRPLANRAGYYERKTWQFGIVLDWWDGSAWRYAEHDQLCGAQNHPWRGLTKEAK